MKNASNDYIAMCRRPVGRVFKPAAICLTIDLDPASRYNSSERSRGDGGYVMRHEKAIAGIVVGVLSVICAHGAEVTVHFDQPIGTQPMAYGTNELANVFLDSWVAADRLAEINTQYARYWVPGSNLNPSPNVWQWHLLDGGVERVLQSGAVPMVCWENMPDWMEDPDNRPFARDLNEWADYCLTMVDHCAEQGYRVEDWLWEIWNEPNNSGISSSEYLQLYDSASAVLRAAYPNLKIGGPSTAWTPSSYIVPLLSGNHDVQFVTWHWYGAWDPGANKPSHEYLAETYVFGREAAQVQGWIDTYRPGTLNICGELNFNAYCCPRDERIWEMVFAPYYMSVMRHLLLNRCDVEMIFVGTDGAGTGYGLFFGIGPEAGLRSPGFFAKKIFSTAAPAGCELLTISVEGSSHLEALATRDSDAHCYVILINKTTSVTPVTMTIRGLTFHGGGWHTIDQAAYDDGGVRYELLPPGQAPIALLDGYAVKVLEMCPDGVECDIDRDGWGDDQDNCPIVSNPQQGEFDGDGVGDRCDNCPQQANSDQRDDDGDEIGNACDSCPAFDSRIDHDADGVPDGCDLCPGTPTGARVTLEGCATPQADFDRDGDVDQGDFGHFQACYSGAGQPQDDPDCLDARLDVDLDVDLSDFGLFQTCLSGANMPADPDCAD